jgi:tetratricopeptide (TPR) repeat protein
MNHKNLKPLLIFLFFSYQTFGQQTADEWIKSGNKNDSLKKYQEALKCFDNAYKLSTGNVNALYYRGYVKYEMGDFKNALNDFDAVLKKDSDDAETFFNRGNIRFKLENYAGAIADYTKALTLNPNDAECYYNRAIAEYNADDTSAACQDLEEASKRGDKMADGVIKELCN